MAKEPAAGDEDEDEDDGGNGKAPRPPREYRPRKRRRKGRSGITAEDIEDAKEFCAALEAQEQCGGGGPAKGD
jgi:hypothetical protein